MTKVMPPLVPVRIWQEIPVLTPSPTSSTPKTNTIWKTSQKKLDDGKEYSFITIDYSNFRALRIQQKVDTFEHNSTATTPSDNEIANISEIPSLFITDMYPLSMHAVAIYGKILGEPANYLITQLIPDSNGESEETTTYTYTLDNRGIVTSCHAVVRHIRNGYEQDYTRTVNYTIE